MQIIIVVITNPANSSLFPENHFMKILSFDEIHNDDNLFVCNWISQQAYDVRMFKKPDSTYQGGIAFFV